MYARPLFFTPDPKRPLLIASCSNQKAERGGLVRIGELYDGPIWRDIRRSGFPMTNVGAISAQHGFLEPGAQVETYDRIMDEKIAARIAGTGCHVSRLARMVDQHPATYVQGGALYRSIVETAMRYAPEIKDRVTFATGSYLEQRQQINEWLRRSSR